MRFLPGLLGLGSISWGAAMIYTPAGFITAGAALLLIDAKIPDIPRRDPGA